MDASAISYDHDRGIAAVRCLACDFDVSRRPSGDGDAVAIGWLVDARMRKLRRLCGTHITG